MNDQNSEQPAVKTLLYWPDRNILLSGRIYPRSDIVDSHNLEFNERETKEFSLLQDIDGTLCESAELIRARDGQHFLCWHENHPSLKTPCAYYGVEKWSALSCEQRMAWGDLQRQLPLKKIVKPLTRSEAAQIVAYLWLPNEFFAEIVFKHGGAGG
jgi:hypothetical protein